MPVREKQKLWRRLIRGNSSPPVAPVAAAGPSARPDRIQVAETRSRAVLDAALQELDPEERDVIRRNLPGPSTDIGQVIRRARDAASTKASACESKKWEWTLFGRTVVLRDEAAKVVRWLDRFKSVGDVVANVDPLHVGLPWAGIRMLLEVAVADHHQVAALVTGMSLASTMADRLQVYWTYSNQLPPSPATTNFENAIVRLYAQVLRFLAKAITAYERNPLQRMSRALWQGVDLEDFERVCDKLAQRAEVEASNCDRELDYGNWQNLQITLRRIEQEQGKLSRLQESMARTSVKADLRGLATVENAIYNSHDDEDLGQCLEGTRIDIRNRIRAWALDPTGKSIFWLRGMAGTGKSTIVRTAAHELDHHYRRLGASFFFKRGEGDRGHAGRFFSTIAVQLAARIDGLDDCIARVLERESFVAAQSLRDQFRKLLLDPLLELSSQGKLGATVFVIVIDALDECDRIVDVQTIISLLGEVGLKSALRLRVLVTSRSEVPIVAGIENLDSGLHEDIVLEDVQAESIEGDIRTYLRHQFLEIKRRDSVNHLYEPIPQTWPIEVDFQAVAQLATPLFIFAATICRHLSSDDPQQRLSDFLSQQRKYSLSGLEAVYLPILNRLLVKQDSSDVVANFRRVVGSIILLTEPLPVRSLATFLGITLRTIDTTLRDLHSVLKVPRDPYESVHLLHLSFRDFLVDRRGDGEQHTFWIDSPKTHLFLWRRCMCTLRASLRRDMGDFGDVGLERETVSDVSDFVNPELAYACRNWVHHLTNSQSASQHGEDVLDFLQTHLLHWLEVMSWLGRISDALARVRGLKDRFMSHEVLGSFLRDAHQFIKHNLTIMDEVPLQIYASAIIFAPKTSAVKATFEGSLMVPLSFLPEVDDDWGTESHIFDDKARHCDFSSDGKTFAYLTEECIKVWDLANSERVRIIQVISHPLGLRFLRNPLHALIWNFRRLSVWNLATGVELRAHKIVKRGHIELLDVTSDEKYVAIVIGVIEIEVRDFESWECLWRYCPSSRVIFEDIKFITDHWTLTAITKTGDSPRSLDMFHATQSEPLNRVPLPYDVTVTAYSPDGRSLATGAEGCPTQLYELDDDMNVSLRHQVRISAYALSYSRDGRYVLVGSGGCVVTMLSVETGKAIREFKSSFAGGVWHLRSSHDNRFIAAVCLDLTMRLWDSLEADDWQSSAPVKSQEIRPWRHSSKITCVSSHAGRDLGFSASEDGDAMVWSTRDGQTVRSLHRPEENSSVDWVCFSLDGDQIVSLQGSSEGSRVRLWDVPGTHSVQSKQLKVLPSGPVVLSTAGLCLEWRWFGGGPGHTVDASLSPLVNPCYMTCDGVQIHLSRPVISRSGVIVLEAEQMTDYVEPSLGDTITFLGLDREIRLIAVSPDCEIIVTASTETISIWVRDVKPALKSFPRDVTYWTRPTFSPSSSLLAFMSERDVVVWRRATNDVLQRMKIPDKPQAMAIDSTDRLLASSSMGSLRLFDIRSGTQIWCYSGFHWSDLLHFTDDGMYIETRLGRVSIANVSEKTSGIGTAREIYCTNDWIFRKGRKVIWMPPNFRVDDVLHPCTTWQDNTIIIGHPSGIVTIIRFKDDEETTTH